MTLKGDEALAHLEALAKRAADDRAERLAKAKEAAAAAGKEPFDLEKLETMCDTSREGRMDPIEVRRARFEEMYYVDYPRVMTLEDFARKVEEQNRW